ncbi:phage major capsid protein [Agrobacterium rosae]|uniref:Phage major capsid protein n=1 Tax=Agrobacterium rosae TaxID=1972867 RepID=A0ABU4VZJ8_9HYPH|nr:phage major capsid protein [Agrobacterium rosae]KAA3514402.1 phage major capsid protein [Agrobacterium rosae]KAA3523068.1 phage major capsid protein [Agrobacterium rosae]MCM2436347.1 phage major capsid protein [Agrobacterium rosae]MDX8329822.1 phage major capsid protein [Agrobacterium rosae]MQB47784.1 phage major capsid protein [Agrobacterium rosae]
MTEQTVAPQIKAVPDTMTAAFDDFMEAFEAFRETNDERLGDIERKMGADVLTREKLDRIDKALDDNKKVMDELSLKRARPALGRKGAANAETEEHKAAFEAYIRRGDEGALRDLEAKAFSGSAGADGGYLLPQETDSDIGKRMSVVSPMRALSTVRQVSGAVLKKPFAPSGMATGWVSETAARPQTNTPQLSELTFPTMELYAMPAATQGLLDDSAVDIEAWIASEVDVAFAEQEGAAFISGDGVNKPKGLLAYDTVANSAWEWGKIGYVATGAAGAFASSGPLDVLIDTVYSLKAGHRQNGSFLMNRKTQSTLRRVKDTTGNYLWQPPASAGQAALLMGFPVAEAEDMPDVAAGSTSIAFGDFRAGYLVVDRTGIRILRDPYSAKPYVLFYTTKRVGGGVQNFEAVKLVKFAAS